jgi:hypothetical protein
MGADDMSDEDRASAGEALTLLTARMNTQHSTWDSLDAKTLNLMGFGAATFAIFLTVLANQPLELWKLLLASISMALLLLAAFLAVQEYFPSQISTFIPPADIICLMDRKDAVEKWCQSLRIGIEENRTTIERKACLTKWVILVVSAQVLFSLTSALINLWLAW